MLARPPAHLFVPFCFAHQSLCPHNSFFTKQKWTKNQSEIIPTFLMIIRNRTTKTLEASSLNNRGCAVPPDRDKRGTSTLKGSPIMLFGHSFRVLASIVLNIRGCSLRSYPRLLSEDRVAVSLVVWLRIIKLFFTVTIREWSFRLVGLAA